MPINIRPARPEDAPSLLRLNIEFNGPGEQTLDGVEKSLSLPGPEQVLVAEASEGNELVGFCCCLLKRSFCYREPSAEITEFYVDKSHRRQGIGRDLLKAAVALCKSCGACEITLLTGADNRAAQALYRGSGFAPSGELHMGLES